jgi:NAD(P)-dependent dehydrogenase (short-subunit alcohol dehydrogenase family)
LSSPNKKKSKDKDKDDDDVPPKVIGLTGLIQYHGVAFNGPSLYMPIDMYGRQMDVNFLGTIRIVQAFMPLMKQSIKDSINELGNSGNGDKDKEDLLYRGRIILTGTGGGSCSPCPPLLTAYMSSKFALEAYTQSLRQELYMTSCPIDVSIINPGTYVLRYLL